MVGPTATSWMKFELYCAPFSEWVGTLIMHITEYIMPDNRPFRNERSAAAIRRVSSRLLMAVQLQHSDGENARPNR